MFWIYFALTAWFALVLINALFIFDIDMYFKFVWSDNHGFIPISKISGNYGQGLFDLTNAHKDAKYRLKPYIRFRCMQRYYTALEKSDNKNDVVEIHTAGGRRKYEGYIKLCKDSSFGKGSFTTESDKLYLNPNFINFEIIWPKWEDDKTPTMPGHAEN